MSLVTFGVIYFTAMRLGLDRRLAATLGTGGAVCGVSGAIATAGAVGARKEQASIAISLVIFWAILAIFILPLLARALQLPTGVAGAWIGTSEFADAAGPGCGAGLRRLRRSRGRASPAAPRPQSMRSR